MLTLSDTFTSAFDKSDVEPVMLVQFWTDTSGPLFLCTGSKIIDFPSIYNYFTGDTDPGVTAYPSVQTVTQLTQELDPFHRGISRTAVTVTIVDDGVIRDWIKLNRVLHQAVIITLGTTQMTDPTEWASVFRGVIKGWTAREGQIDIHIKDHFHYSNLKYYGTWIGLHPLEAIKKILQDQGLPTSLIIADSFDFTHADYADIRHYVHTMEGTDQMSGPYHSPRRHGLVPEQRTLQLVNELAKMMIGTAWFNEDGKLQFSRYDEANTIRAHWTTDDIGKFSQQEEIIVNQIEISLRGAFGIDRHAQYILPSEGVFKLRDTTSQTNFAAPGDTKAVFAEGVDFEIIAYTSWASGSDIPASGGTVIRVSKPWGICGARVSGDYVVGATWESMQATGSQLSDTRPLYMLIDDEVIRCRSFDMLEDDIRIVQVHDGAEFLYLTEVDLKHVPSKSRATVATSDRGQFGTDVVEHDAHTGLSRPITDVTMAVAFAETQIARFANGCPIVDVSTNLSQIHIQIGDFVTIENDVFLTYNFDGITSVMFWEIIKKDVRLDTGSGEIQWTLAYATQTSPPTLVKDYGFWRRELEHGVIQQIADGAAQEVGICNHVNHGLGISSSGLDVTIAAGAGALGGRLVPYLNDVVHTVVANKDHWFSFGIRDGGVNVHTVDTGSDQPIMDRGETLLGKVVAGGSTCTITDLRQYGAIRPRNISSTDFEAGQNLVMNPRFEVWSRGSGHPPDHWEIVSSLDTWGEDALREEANPISGTYSISIMEDESEIEMQSSKFRVEPGRVYEFGGSALPANVNQPVALGIYWYTAAGVYISRDWAIFESGLASTSVVTTQHAKAEAPATAEFASIYFSVSDPTAGDALPVVFDNIRCMRSMPSFAVTLASTQTITKSLETTVAFNTIVESHEYGDYNTVGQNFTAKFDGIYDFTCQLSGLDYDVDVANGGFLGLSINGSIKKTGVAGDKSILLRSGPIRMEAGDFALIRFHAGDAQNIDIPATNKLTWFSGYQIL